MTSSNLPQHPLSRARTSPTSWPTRFYQSFLTTQPSGWFSTFIMARPSLQPSRRSAIPNTTRIKLPRIAYSSLRRLMPLWEPTRRWPRRPSTTPLTSRSPTSSTWTNPGLARSPTPTVFSAQCMAEMPSMAPSTALSSARLSTR